MDIDFSEFHTLLPEDDDCPDIVFSVDDLDMIHSCLNFQKLTLSEYLSLPNLEKAERQDITFDLNHISSLIDRIENVVPGQDLSWNRGIIPYDD